MSLLLLFNGGAPQTEQLQFITNTPTVFSPAVLFPLNETFPGASGAPAEWWTTSVVAGGTVGLDTNRLKYVATAQGDVARALFNKDVIPANAVIRVSYTFTTNTAQDNGFNFRGDGVWQSSGNRHVFTNGLMLTPTTNTDQVKLFTTVASSSTLLGQISLTINATDTVNMAVVTSGSTVYWKAWIAGTLEPTEWQTATDSNHSARTRLGLAVQNPLTSNPITSYYDDLTANVESATQNVVDPFITNTPTVYSPTVTLAAATFSETWTGGFGNPWPAQWVTDNGSVGTVDLQSNKGRMNTGGAIYGRAGARNAAAFLSQDYTLQVDVTIPTFTEWYFMVHVRGSGTLTNTYQLPSAYQLRFSLSGGAVIGGLYEVDASGTESFRTGLSVSGTPAAGDTVRLSVQVAGTTTLKAKAWKVGTADPGYTDLTLNVATIYTGAFFALSVQGGNDTTGEDFLWDDLTVSFTTLSVTVPFVTNTVSVFAPAAQPGPVTMVLPLVTNAPTVFSPAALLGAKTAQLPFITNAVSVFSPSVTVGAVTAVLPFITNTVTVYTPDVRPVQTLVLPFITNAPTVFSPSATLGNPIIGVPFVDATPTVFTPRVSANTQTATLPIVYARTTGVLLDSGGLAILDSNGLPLLDGTQGAFSPGVTLGIPIVTVPFVTNTTTVFSPTVRGAQYPILPFITNTLTVFAPSIVSGQNIVLPFITNALTVFSPSVNNAQPVALPFVTNTVTVYSPSVSFPTGTIVMLRVNNPSTVFAPAVNPLLLTIGVDFVVNRPSVFTPSLRYGTYTFEPPHDEQGPRKLSEDGRRRAGVSRAANKLAARYGGPRSFSVLKIGGVYQQIQNPTMDQVNAATEYYAGGHIYEVTYQQAVALQAAGFDVEGI